MRAIPVLVCLLSLFGAAQGGEVRESHGLTFSLRVPRGWRPGGLMVVAFHGEEDDHASFLRVLETFDFLDDAVLVVPNAPQDATWISDNIDPVAGLLAEVQEELGPGRTSALGFSRGAFFVFGFGLEKATQVEGVVAHSGGLIQAIPRGDDARRQVFYVIHGTADGVVRTDQSRAAVKLLAGEGIKVEYEPVTGLAHHIDPEACEHGFAWLERNLGALGLSDEDAKARLEAIEALVKAGDFAAAAEAWREIRGLSDKLQRGFSKLARKHVEHEDEDLARAAIAACAELGSHGVGALKRVPADDEDRTIAAAQALGENGNAKAFAPLEKLLGADAEAVGVAAARGLESYGGDEAVEALIDKLADFEQLPVHAERSAAILRALEALTGESFASAGQWQAWQKKR